MKTTVSNHRKAFTLVEIMIVVAIIGILSAVTIPNFVKSNAKAKQNTCIENMLHIKNAEDMWALDTNASVGTTPLKADIISNYLRSWPKCGSTEYAIPAVGSNPACPLSASGHTLSASGTGGGTPPPPPPASRGYASP